MRKKILKYYLVNDNLENYPISRDLPDSEITESWNKRPLLPFVLQLSNFVNLKCQLEFQRKLLGQFSRSDQVIAQWQFSPGNKSTISLVIVWIMQLHYNNCVLWNNSQFYEGKLHTLFLTLQNDINLKTNM